MSDVQSVVISNDCGNEVQKVRDVMGLPSSWWPARPQLWYELRCLCRESLYFLTKAVLGYKDLTKKTHYEYCRFLQDLSNKRTLDLMPRGVFKTTCGTIGFSIWYLLNFPNHYILIANQTESNAQRMLLEIEAHLDGSNPRMLWLFPEFINPGGSKVRPWNQSKMAVPNRDAYGGIISGMPSIQAVGVGKRAESLHYHVVINDDLIGEKAMVSDIEMLSAITWHDYSVSLFVSPKTGIERMHGTRWSLSDIYSVILENPKYKYFVRSAKDPETGELFFPELLDEETLADIRENNYAVYMSQYMNDPDNPEVLDFRANWLRKYKLFPSDNGPYCVVDGAKFFVKDMDVVLAVDPAASGDIDTNFAEVVKRGRARKANNAVEIWGLHGSGRYFLLDLWAGRGRGENPEIQVAQKMLDMALRWRGYLRRGYVESYGAQRALITIFKMLAQQNQFSLRMEETPRGVQKAKKVRIRSMLAWPAENGLICIRPIHDRFEYEFSKFPQSDLFDTLDAAYWAFYHLKKPMAPVEAADRTARREQHKRMRIAMVGRGGY